MKSLLPSSAAFAAILSFHGVESFAPPSRGVAQVQVHHGQTLSVPSPHGSSQSPTNLFASNDGEIVEDDVDSNNSSPSRRARFLSTMRQKSKPITLALVTTAAFLPGQLSLLRPLPAQASAPIVLRAAKKKDEPPIVVALNKAKELKKAKSLEEFDSFMAKCNDIEVEEGKKARDAYEKQYHLDKAAADAQKKVDVETLKRELLDLGQDPHTDLDAEHAVFLLEHDIDLEKIPGTPQNERMIKNFQKRGRQRRKGGADTAPVVVLEKQRFLIAAAVADLKAHGVDPLAHFARKDVMDKTRAIYKMDDRIAAQVAVQYEGLMEEYGGRLTPPQEGEVPFVYSPGGVSEAAVTSGVASGGSLKAEKAVAKAVLREQRAADKEVAREARVIAKGQAKAERSAAKEQKLAEKAAGAAAALAAKEAASAGATVAVASLADVDVAATADEDVFVAESSIEQTAPTTAATSGSKANEIITQIKTAATPRNAATVLIGAGAAVYGVNYYRDNNGAAQSERERQLKLILGADEDDEEEDDEEDDDDEFDDYEQFTKQTSPEPPQSKPKSDDTPKAAAPKPTPPTPAEAAPKAKPKRLGIFSKRNANLRETDLNAMVKPNAQAPEFAALLAKILTFGAPGRFPGVASWGSMPFDDFDLDNAKSLLTESRGAAELTDEQSAEIFASVVNCMIIDIVDLASSTLKVKKNEDEDDKITVDAINVVMDFMDHAASLFDAVAEDVTIKPVTYGGKLRKKDLEQMFSVYSSSSMMGGEATQDRIDTLQLVFAITDKKAEGLMQKHMMKTMMNLMKDGGKGMEGMPGMEGMEEMMAAMGGGGPGGMPGMEGMPGMPGMDGGEMSPEDLKQTLGMMKELMDSGQVSDEELVEVRKQFKEMYGSDISDLIKKASDEGAEAGMTDDEKELTDLFKQILGE
eukprot:CAMPEP_0201884950 /NCGR_PEP_ID=MMETSP0902-20130614/17641_1 /ASSEMBLY_ACC=CAM_ASM_000551 /TAXON_ID=420261 /ORGANISM="Thalassiosira antarctica, Strain CCMP982" /LENGTH=919 /DNA_ID=CAMNT_0048413971 /DNA_START=32 /DNA_END=2791 /DNA_ORIENTATION=-